MGVDEGSAHAPSELLRTSCSLYELWVFDILGYMELRSTDQVSINTLGYSGLQTNKWNKHKYIYARIRSLCLCLSVFISVSIYCNVHEVPFPLNFLCIYTHTLTHTHTLTFMYLAQRRVYLLLLSKNLKGSKPCK